MDTVKTTDGNLLTCTQDPYLDSTHDPYLDTACMRAHATDEAGNEYRVTWPLKDGWRDSEDDLSFLTIWDNPTIVGEGE